MLKTDQPLCRLATTVRSDLLIDDESYPHSRTCWGCICPTRVATQASPNDRFRLSTAKTSSRWNDNFSGGGPAFARERQPGPRKPTIGQVKSIVSGVPITDIAAGSTNNIESTRTPYELASLAPGARR